MWFLQETYFINIKMFFEENLQMAVRSVNEEIRYNLL